MNGDSFDYRDFVLWAVSLADPLVRSSDAARWRAAVVPQFKEMRRARVSSNVQLPVTSVGSSDAPTPTNSEDRATSTFFGFAVGELLAGVAVVVPDDDSWRRLVTRPSEVEGNREAWWDDCYPTADETYYGGQLVPVPNAAEVQLMGWSLSQSPGRAGMSPSASIDDVEMVAKMLLARFRAHEPGVDVREFMLDVAEAAWALADVTFHEQS